MLIQESLDYTVQLPAFEGPLDLLLRLIEREELDITTIALAQVADKYLAQVRAMPAPDPAALSAFLVIAARLLLIKSRALLPRPATSRGPDEPIDEGEELARQLREYQRYKQAAALLRTWDEQGRRAYTRIAPPPPPALPRPHTPLDVTLGEMIAAVQRRMQLLLPLDDAVTALPAPKIVTVPEMAERIRERLRRQAWFSFEDLLSLAAQRVEVVVALWAVLELLKRRSIVVEQEQLFGPILIGRGPNLDATDMHALASDEPEPNGSEG
ncbi:MAG TPA: ScpA family protein [Roseiflexaceae bacterium]|nr:ScpA family protein [Roseiflexaceae bacterium]